MTPSLTNDPAASYHACQVAGRPCSAFCGNVQCVPEAADVPSPIFACFQQPDEELQHQYFAMKQRAEAAEAELAALAWRAVADGLPTESCRILVRWAKAPGIGHSPADAASFLLIDQFDRPNYFVVRGGFNPASKFSHWMPMPTCEL